MASPHTEMMTERNFAWQKGNDMARISYVENDQAAPEVQPIFERFAKALGRIPNIFKAMAHAPVLFQKFIEFDGAMRSTKLDRKLRELAYLRASQVNHCDY
jgi:alkylhydroperoxidase family enzyme